MSHDDERSTTDKPIATGDEDRQRALDALRRETEAEARLWKQRGRRPGDIEDEEVPDEPVVDSKTDLPDTGDPDDGLADEGQG